jgi:peptide/nickel transport system substrate-binding protein
MTIDRHGTAVASNGTAPEQVADVLTRRHLLGQAAALGGVAALSTRDVTTILAGHSGSDEGHNVHAPAQEESRTFTIGAMASPETLDPHAAYEYHSIMAILGAYEGLIGLKDGQTDQYEGLIAESWEPNEDKSVWTFHLRDGVTFHDGSPVDAEAVRASFERFLTLGLATVGVITRFLSDPAQITIPNPRTVVFDLGKPQPLFEAAIASTYGPEIVNAKRLREFDVDGDWGHAWAAINESGIGSGPYEIARFEPGQSLDLVSYDGYWRGWDGDQFDHIVIRVVPEDGTRRQLIEQGEVDIVDNLTPDTLDVLQRHPDLVVDERSSTQVQYFIMNVVGSLATPEARRALCCAFPYWEVVKGVYKGHARQAIGAVAETVRGFAPGTYQHTTDMTEARALLATAGVSSGTELRVAIPAGDAEITATAELFQANLSALGFKVTIDARDNVNYTALLYGDSPPEDRPHLMLWGWWPDYNDAWNHLYPQVSCNSQGSKGANAGFYCNQQVEALLARAKDPASTTEYEQALADIQQIISYDDPPAVYYLQPNWTTILRNHVTGFVFNPINVGTFNFWKLRRKS